MLPVIRHRRRPPYPVTATAPQSNTPPATHESVPQRTRDWVRFASAVAPDVPTLPIPVEPRHTQHRQAARPQDPAPGIADHR